MPDQSHLPDSPCRYSSGSTSLTCGDLRAHAGRIVEENRCRAPSLRIDTFVVDPRRLHLDRAGRGQHLPWLVIPVAHHQPAAILIELVDELLHIGGDLAGRRRGQHLPDTIADNLIQQRPTSTAVVLVGGFRVVNYREHGRTFPTSTPTPVLIRTTSTFRSSSGRCAHIHPAPPRLIHRF